MVNIPAATAAATADTTLRADAPSFVPSFMPSTKSVSCSRCRQATERCACQDSNKRSRRNKKKQPQGEKTNDSDRCTNEKNAKIYRNVRKKEEKKQSDQSQDQKGDVDKPRKRKPRHRRRERGKVGDVTKEKDLAGDMEDKQRSYFTNDHFISDERIIREFNGTNSVELFPTLATPNATVKRGTPKLWTRAPNFEVNNNEKSKKIEAQPSLDSTPGLTLLSPPTRLPIEPTATKGASEVTRDIDKKEDEKIRVNHESGIYQNNSSMSRLRERWWRNVEQAQMRQQFREELSERLIVLRRKIENEELKIQEAKGPSAKRDEVVDEVAPPGRDFSPASDYPSRGLNPHTGATSDYELAEILSSIIHEGNLSDLQSFVLPSSEMMRHKTISEHRRMTGLPPVHLAVHLNKPTLLQILISNKFSRVLEAMESSNIFDSPPHSPLMLAAKRGSEECLVVLLHRCIDSGGFTFNLSERDEMGNTVVHYCCSGESSSSTLQILLTSILNGGGKLGKSGRKAHQQQLSKILLTKNQTTGQTSIHVACSHGRVDLVETFLSICNSVLLTKLLSVQDNNEQTPLLAAVAGGSTDVVMSLIMWRSNHHTPRGNSASKFYAPSTETDKKKPPCPLVWAARKNDLEMIHLLLEFSDTSSSEYDTTEALHTSLLAPSNEETPECVRILIQAGGNPFRSMSRGGTEQTAVDLASTSSSNVQILHVLIGSGRSYLSQVQSHRRRDAALQLQQESFFKSIEETEDLEMESALTNALVASLYRSYFSNSSQRSLDMAMTLLESGAKLDNSSLFRLRKSIVTGSLVPSGDAQLPMTVHPLCVLSSLDHPAQPGFDTLMLDLDRSPVSYWSRQMLRLAWAPKRHVMCPWINDFCETRNKKQLPQPRKVILVCQGRTRFEAHPEILSLKSAKLAAAIRFATMKQDLDDGDDEMLEINVLLEPRQFLWMLQHMYHGSIVDERNLDCRNLLDLLLVAEEFLCPTLVEECQLRLLSSPATCLCWSCAKSIRSTADGHVECLRIQTTSNDADSLINPSTVLDVMAVAQHLEEREGVDEIPLPDSDSRIRVVSDLPAAKLACMDCKSVWKRVDDGSPIRGVAALIDQVACYILTNFTATTGSRTFHECVMGEDKTEEVDSITKHIQMSCLLSQCSEILAASAITRMLNG